MPTNIIGTARIVSTAGSSQRSGVRPSVPSAAEHCCCGFAAAGPLASRYRSTAARPALASATLQHGAQQQMRSVPRCQLTQAAEHRLVSYVEVMFICWFVCLFSRRHGQSTEGTCFDAVGWAAGRASGL